MTEIKTEIPKKSLKEQSTSILYKEQKKSTLSNRTNRSTFAPYWPKDITDHDNLTYAEVKEYSNSF